MSNRWELWALTYSPTLKDTLMAKDVFIPEFSQAQLDYLNKLYPEKCPEPNDTDREIWMRVGQRQVVRHIEALFLRQVERSLGSK